MRINLVTPFAEKDAVKALGARWDAAKKCWYIVNVEDLTPFLPWIPNANPTKKGYLMDGTLSKAVMPSAPTLTDWGRADCGCDVLPWEDCAHTAK